MRFYTLRFLRHRGFRPNHRARNTVGLVEVGLGIPGALDLADETRGVAGDERERRHVLRHDAACAHCRAAPDADAGEDGDVACDPNIRLDVDGAARLGTLHAVADGWVERMGAAVEVASRADEDTGANANG